MKKLQSYIVLLIMVITFSSCGTLWDFAVLPFSGVDKEKDLDITKYLPECEYLVCDLDTLYRDSISHSRNYIINIWKFEHDEHGASPIQTRMYDKGGNYAGAYEFCFGNAKDLGVYKKVPITLFENSSYESINKTISLKNDVKLLNISDVEKQKNLDESNKYDYNIVIFWNDFGGYYTKRHLRQVKKYINKNDLYKFRAVYLHLL